MPHMQPQFESGEWVEVDTTEGTTFIPPGLVTLPDESDYTDDDGNYDEEGYNEAAGAVVRDYVSGRVLTITTRQGVGARLSAPGYLDCTDWSVYDSYAEAVDGIADDVLEDGPLFSVIEYSSFFAVRHNVTGDEHPMGDGVDTLFDIGNDVTLKPGDEGFVERWADSLNATEGETLAAYFPQLV